MKLANAGTVPVYTVSGSSASRTLPEWLARQKKGKGKPKHSPDQTGRVQILQDFLFDEASICVRVSEDGEWAMSTGTYKPQIHVHNLSQLSLAFARHTNSQNHSFTLLSEDYSKSVHLQIDRRLELQTPMGCHYEVRIPRYGRDVLYDRQSTEVLVPAVGLDVDGKGEVFRLNLELGRFMKSYQVDVEISQRLGPEGLQGSVDVGSVNAVANAERSHNLLAFGTSIGTDFWDPRSKARIAHLPNSDGQVTALDFNPSGLSLITGSSTGMIQIFDLRRSIPLLTKDQGFGFPIKKLIHMDTVSQGRKVLSADKRVVKIWDELTGDPWTAIEPEVDINDIAWCKNTGMLLSANEGKQQHAWFVPMLGPAPKWCAFLDNMVEEMAESVRTETYENYKFLTIPELKSLSLAHLVGKTSLLRPYMHGYFVASKLYDQARLIVNPYMWDEERLKRVQAKIEKERQSRIRSSKKVKINQNVVDRLLKKQESKSDVELNATILGDSRFSRMFEDEEFIVDENSREFRLLNPNYVSAEPTEEQAMVNVSSNRNNDGEPDDVASSQRANRNMVLVSSSTTQKRQTNFGSRVRNNSGIERVHSRQVLGERKMTFVPKSQEGNTGSQNTKMRPERKDRRSASSNTFRRM